MVRKGITFVVLLATIVSLSGCGVLLGLGMALADEDVLIVSTVSPNETYQVDIYSSGNATTHNTVIANVTVTATYTSTVRTYTVTWYDGVGSGNGASNFPMYLR